MKKYLPYLIIALVCIAGFHPVAFLSETLKYDILDGYLPGHYFVSECLRNGEFPLWNPYQQLGFPIYADLTSTNYPVNLCIGRLFPYTNITFHILFIVYLIIGGWGAYKLSGYLNISRQISLLTGIAYPLSGFFTGNAQHMQFIIGAAWLPFVLLYFLRFSSSDKIRDVLLFVMATSLLVTGGYPPTAILLLYLLAVIFIIRIIYLIRNKETKHALRFALHCTLAGMLVVALCSGLLVSIWQSTPFVSRYVQLDYETAITNSFSPESLISLLSPLTPVVHPELFHTDLSMNNLYFSGTMLMLLVYGLLKPKGFRGWFLLGAGLLILLISFGENFFLHKILYDHLPLFDKFRHPSNLRVFSILSFLLFAGLQVSQHNPADNRNFDTFRKTGLIFLGSVLLICLISFVIIIIKAAGPVDFKPVISSIWNDYGIFGTLFYQTCILLLVNSGFLFFILIRKKKEYLLGVLLVTILIETVVFTQRNLPYTVTSEYKPLEIRNFLRNRPAGFPLPDHHVLADNTEQSVAFVPLIHNTNTYAKTVSPYVRYPFTLNGYTTLTGDTLLFRHAIENELLYFADTLLPERHQDDFRKAVYPPGKNYAFVEDLACEPFSPAPSPYASADGTIKCRDFSPSRFSFETRSSTARFAVLLQHGYPGWKAYVDGTESRIIKVNHTLMGVMLPPGDHTLTFQYRNDIYRNLIILSLVLFLILFMLAMVQPFKERFKTPHYGFYAGLTVAVVLGGLVMILVKHSGRDRNIVQRNNNEINEILKKEITKEELKNAYVVFNGGAPYPFPDDFPAGCISQLRFRTPGDGIRLWNLTDTLKTDRLIYIWSNVLDLPATPGIIRLNFPQLSKHYRGHRYSVSVFERQAGKHESLLPGTFYNDYENPSAGWTLDKTHLDSTMVFQGRYAEKLTAEKEFSATFRTITGKAGNKESSIFAALRFRAEGNQPFHMVITVNRDNKTLYYHAVDLREFSAGEDNWNKGFASRQFLNKDLREGDEIAVYCWNSGKNEALYLDDFRVFINSTRPK